jgi:hypothetical protein
MKNLSTFNKLFLIFCAAVIVFLALKVPREKQHQSAHQESSIAPTE